MKPDKPAPPSRDRDILRARNTRTLKTSPSQVATSHAGTSSDAGPSTSSETTAGAGEGGGPSSGEEARGGEMRVYLDKLRELVPYVPRTGKISKVRLIHSAIDYITDLQESLEARARRKLREKDGQGSRQPLAALPQGPQQEAAAPALTPLSQNSVNRLAAPPESTPRQPLAHTILETFPFPTTAGDSSGTGGGISNSSNPVSPAAPGPPPDPT